MTRPPVDVRPAGLADVDDLVQLWTSAREELARNGRPLGAADAEGLRRRLATALAEDGLQVVLARWAGRPAGYALMRVAALAPLLDGVVLHVDHLFVLPELRRHGIARALLAMVAGTAERLGADQVVAGAPAGARDAHRYLARLGFSSVQVRRVAPTAVLRRRLAGESGRSGLDDLLSRRRSLRARASWPGRRAGSGTGDGDRAESGDGAVPAAAGGAGVPEPAPVPLPPAPDTLELPLVTEADLLDRAPAPGSHGC